MNTKSRKMHIGIAIGDSGVQTVGWRLPDSNSKVPSFGHFVETAKLAEDACLDFIFLAKGVSLMSMGSLSRSQPGSEFEPISLLSALAPLTKRIGLVGTASTTFSDPFSLARQFSTLDHISEGRAGWNMVTSIVGHSNYSRASMPSPEEKYEIAEEHLRATTSLWDSWEDDAKVFDRESGIYADTTKIHSIDFEGKYFQVEGPLDISRSPQGRPVLVQAGSSEVGIRFGVKWADVVFTAQHEAAAGQSFYSDFKRRLVLSGRDPNQVAIMPGMSPYIGKTEKEAREKLTELTELTDVSTRIAMVGKAMHVNLQDFELDDHIPREKLPLPEQVTEHPSRYAWYYKWATEDKYTIRQLAERVTAASGHWSVVGSGEQIANEMISRFETGGADGFNILPATHPGTLNDFVEHVLPILQDRGYFRSAYSGDTLRDHFDLQRPESRYSLRDR